VVTGATSAIGFVTARSLAEQGRWSSSSAGMQNATPLSRIKETTGNAAVELLLADLSSQGEVRRLATDIRIRTRWYGADTKNGGESTGVEQSRWLVSAPMVEVGGRRNRKFPTHAFGGRGPRRGCGRRREVARSRAVCERTRPWAMPPSGRYQRILLRRRLKDLCGVMAVHTRVIGEGVCSVWVARETERVGPLKVGQAALARLGWRQPAQVRDASRNRAEAEHLSLDGGP